MNDTLSLCYHAVSDDWPADLAMPAARMREQVQTLLDRGYEGVTFTEALERRGSGEALRDHLR